MRIPSGFHRSLPPANEHDVKKPLLSVVLDGMVHARNKKDTKSISLPMLLDLEGSKKNNIHETKSHD